MRKTATFWIIGIAVTLTVVSLFAAFRKPADPRDLAFERARKAGLAIDLSETRPPAMKEDDARPVMERAFALVAAGGGAPDLPPLILEAVEKSHLTWDFRYGEPYSVTAVEEKKFYDTVAAAHDLSREMLSRGKNREALELLAAVDRIGWKLLQNPGKYAQACGSNVVELNVKGWAHALSQPLSLNELAFAAEEIENSTGYLVSYRLFLAEDLAAYRQFLSFRLADMAKGETKISLSVIERLRNTEVVFADELAASFERLGDKDRIPSAWPEAFEPSTKVVLDPKHPSFQYLDGFWRDPTLFADIQTQSWVDSLLLHTAAQMRLEAKKDGIELSKTQALENSRDPITGKPFQFKETANGFSLVSPESGPMPSGMASRDIVLEVRFKN